MNCLSRMEMELYLVEKPTEEQQRAFSTHIGSCSRCQGEYQQLLEEQENLATLLYEDELPDSFVTDVMDKITTSSHRPRIKSRRRMRRMIAAIVALLLVTAGVVNYYTVPSFAQIIRSLFKEENVDIGLLRAMEFGLVQNPGIEVTDHEHTVRVEEVVADPTRVVLALQLRGPAATDDRLLNPGAITIKDQEGHQLGEMYDIGITPDFYYMVAHFAEPVTVDKIIVEGRITSFTNEYHKRLEPIHGQWNFDFTIDMKEAKAKTRVTPIQGEYTTPEGMTIRLKRLTRMVQGVRLELETELSREALLRSPQDYWQKQSLSFHFEDEHGKEIHSVNAREFPHNDSLMTYSSIPGTKQGVMLWSYTFRYLPENKPYYFVIDGYSVSEKDGTKISFEPERLGEEPLAFRSAGDEFMLRRFTIEPNEDPDAKLSEGSLHLEGRMLNDPIESNWVFQDDQGTVYPARSHGSIMMEEERYVLGGGVADPKVLYQFRVPGITTIPKKLLLTRTSVSKWYNNVNWKLPME